MALLLPPRGRGRGGGGEREIKAPTCCPGMRASASFARMGRAPSAPPPPAIMLDGPPGPRLPEFGRPVG